MKEGKLTVVKDAQTGSTVEFWSKLSRIKSSNGECAFELFVQYIMCQHILAYESKNGTLTISPHIDNCIKKTTSTTESSIKKYMKKTCLYHWKVSK